MLVGGRVLEHRMDMDTAFVRKRGIPDVGLVLVGHYVGDFGDET